MINVDIECNPVQGAYIDMIIRKLEKGEPIEKVMLWKKMYLQKITCRSFWTAEPIDFRMM